MHDKGGKAWTSGYVDAAVFEGKVPQFLDLTVYYNDGSSEVARVAVHDRPRGKSIGGAVLLRFGAKPLVRAVLTSPGAPPSELLVKRKRYQDPLDREQTVQAGPGTPCRACYVVLEHDTTHIVGVLEASDDFNPPLKNIEVDVVNVERHAYEADKEYGIGASVDKSWRREGSVGVEQVVFLRGEDASQGHNEKLPDVEIIE